MSGKLDQSLDEIALSRRGGQRRSSRRTAGRPTTTAPVGGISKGARQARGGAANKPAPAKAPISGDSKIIVSNLVSTAPPLPAFVFKG